MVVLIPISIPVSVSSARVGPQANTAVPAVKWQELSDDARQLQKHELDTLAYTYNYPLENILDCDETRTAFEDYLHRIKNQGTCLSSRVAVLLLDSALIHSARTSPDSLLAPRTQKITFS
jgi:hypothetical protein